jgi:hypothetical protein
VLSGLSQGVIALFPPQPWHDEALPEASSVAVDGISTWSTGAVASVVTSAITTIMDLREGTCDRTSFGGCVGCPLCRS